MKFQKWMNQSIGNLEINCSMYLAIELEELARRDDVFVIGDECLITDASLIDGKMLYKLRLSTSNIEFIEVEYNKDYDLLLTYAATNENQKIYVVI